MCRDSPPAPRHPCTDINAQLQGIGSDHNTGAPFTQVLLDNAAFLRQIAAAIALNHLGGESGARSPLAQPAQQLLTESRERAKTMVCTPACRSRSVTAPPSSAALARKPKSH
jgi:hypothetical protein